jgi:hypothetical protein
MSLVRIPSPECDDTPARGFVLVGVAMFVLVLTILGLSLFSLSGFEAQFFARSNERARAFNVAASGIERARFALMATDSLQSVWQQLPSGELNYAVALQGGAGPTDGDSAGKVDWKGPNIWIRTVAQVGVAQVVLQARFDPNEPETFYKRLITARDVQLDVPGPRWSQIYLSGAIMLPEPSFSDTAWNRPPDGPVPCMFPFTRPPIQIHANPLPLPPLDSYFAEKLALPQLQQWSLNGASHDYGLLAGIGNIGYFYRPPNNPADSWTVQENQASTIHVSGTAVWLADPGIDFLDNVTVQGNPITDRLIIVARPKVHGQPTGAIEFEGGLTSDVPLILVSDGKVRFDSQPVYTVATRVAYLSIYCNRVQIGGPDAPAKMELTHPPSLLPNVLDPIIDELFAAGVLPNVDLGTQSRLSLVAGTWEERNANQ